MKDGRPSLIFDIRYFAGYYTSYLKEHHGELAYARRMAWLLNGGGVSLGSYHSLYIYFSPELEPGRIEVTDHMPLWWQCYTHVGVPPQFPDVDSVSEIVMQGTVAALKAILPDCSEIIDDADRVARKHADQLRFLIKTKDYQRYTMDVSSTISAWPNPCHLHVSLTDRASGAFLESTPYPFDFYAAAFDLARSLRLSNNHSEFGVKMDKPFAINLGKFSPLSERPFFSKLVRRPR